jgi:type IV secretion system protein TrbL
MTIVARTSLRNARIVLRVILVVLFVPLLWSVFAPAAAAADIQSPLTTILTTVQSASSGWFAVAQNLAKTLFVTLAAADIAWTGIQVLIQGAEDIKAVLAAILPKILALTFFWTILSNAGTWIPIVINGFVCAGWTIIGQPDGGSCSATPNGTLSIPGADPTAVLGMGLSIAKAMFAQQNVLQFITNAGTVLGTIICAGLIVLGFAFIAGQLMVTLVEAYIIFGVGVLMLGFTGSRWTANLGEKYVAYMTNVGTKLMTLIVIISLGQQVAAEIASIFGSTAGSGALLGSAFAPLAAINTTSLALDLTSELAIVGLVLMYGYLCWHIPQAAGTLLSGQPSMSLSQVANVARGAAMTALGIGAAGLGAAGALAGGGTGLASKLTQIPSALNPAPGGGNDSPLQTWRVPTPAGAGASDQASMFAPTSPQLALAGGGSGGFGGNSGGPSPGGGGPGPSNSGPSNGSGGGFSAPPSPQPSKPANPSGSPSSRDRGFADPPKGDQRDFFSAQQRGADERSAPPARQVAASTPTERSGGVPASVDAGSGYSSPGDVSAPLSTDFADDVIDAEYRDAPASDAAAQDRVVSSVDVPDGTERPRADNDLQRAAKFLRSVRGALNDIQIPGDHGGGIGGNHPTFRH